MLVAFVNMKEPAKAKRKRTVIKVPVLNDGTNTPVPDATIPAPLLKGEAELYKQATNPLGDPHKI
ncbi:MAG: hypothetical protein JWQ57_1899 [Mucilaginibacter sp.]|nr:hypothetical protein [Mucilaginibacter sp.]